MKTTVDHSCKAAARQRGSALAIALIFLLLMTLLGVSAMRESNLQERMAGNLRDRNMAFQAAEAALRAGEQWLLDVGNQNVADVRNPTAMPFVDPSAWDGTGADAVAVAGLYDELANAPTFVAGPPRLRRVGIQLPPEFRRIYPVVAHGEGGSDTAVVILQSTFEPPQ